MGAVKFRLTEKQIEANQYLAGAAQHILLYGGSRSAKTFTTCRAIAIRAQMAPESRHAIFAFRFNRIKQAVVLDTFPKMMRLCYPGVVGKMNNIDCFYTFPNGSEVWFCGLDSDERTEKILGKEFTTMFFNECSQITYDSIQMALTRLAQKSIIKTEGESDREMRNKVYYDENPPKKSHWSYKLFIKHLDPEDGKPLRNPENYVCLKMNPVDNEENLVVGYMNTLNGLSAAKRRRFKDGEFAEDDPNQLFSEDDIEKFRVIDVDEVPDFVKVVVAVDPSGAGDENSEDCDAIGIVVAAMGTNGIAYLVEDRTVKAGPSTWGKVACKAYEDHDADIIIGESNYGGAMIKHVIRTANPRVPYAEVRATRGKHVRAEPISALFEQGKIRIIGNMRELEEELCAFTTNGYAGPKSPNRADAAIWALTRLFPHLTKKPEEPIEYERWEPSDSGAGY